MGYDDDDHRLRIDTGEVWSSLEVLQSEEIPRPRPGSQARDGRTAKKAMFGL